MRRRTQIMIAVAGLACLVAWQASTWAEYQTSSSASTAKTAARNTTKSAGADASLPSEAKILKKLDQILANQETILANQESANKRFDAVMEELRIVKIRASQ